jgi:phosphomannomutase
MFFNEHNPPHFHAQYSGKKVAIDIRTLQVLEGRIEPRALGLVIEWASQHQDELLADWELARQDQQPRKIEPLR